MHCLSAVSNGSASPQRAGSCGSVLGVVRALGVLVSEGRVQGPPRGYKEGPHCAAPMQAISNNHVCEKDNYLCDRYVILVREIADRVTNCSYLCVEVLLCTDCPCGLAKATARDPVSPIPSISIAPWQQSSEMLLEYWCINVVTSKGPEMMNSQSLYQAVRSRLHFSQVAAWWSRSKGVDPSYIMTRIVPYSEDNVRKFRETPSEHTFPLAACGDGKSIKVTVWALPRVEEVPILSCPIHPMSEKEDEDAARALTPTKNLPVPTTTSNAEALVLPSLVDDRLQTPCNEPGKHHCRCEEEDGCPPSPSTRANSERKRRRSVPRGPDLQLSTIPHNSIPVASGLPPVSEQTPLQHERRNHRVKGTECDYLHYNEPTYEENSNHRNTSTSNDSTIRDSLGTPIQYPNEKNVHEPTRNPGNQINQQDREKEERKFEKFISSESYMEEPESNVEKRYKLSVEPFENFTPIWHQDKSPKFNRTEPVSLDRTRTVLDSDSLQSNMSVTSAPEEVYRFCSSFQNMDRDLSTINRNDTEHDRKPTGKMSYNLATDQMLLMKDGKNVVVNPFSESSPFHEPNPGPSSHKFNKYSALDTSPVCSVHQGCFGKSSCLQIQNESNKNLPLNNSNKIKLIDIQDNKSIVPSNDLGQLMSKLKLSESKDKIKDDRGILDWISRVPARVLGVASSNEFSDYETKTSIVDTQIPDTSEIKSKQNCNLELSQREFDEVLAVLRTRTPTSRKRTPFRTTKRRDKSEKHADGSNIEQNNYKPTSEILNNSDSVIHSNVHKILATDKSATDKFYKNNNYHPLVSSVKRDEIEARHKSVRKGAKLLDSNHQEGQSLWLKDEKCLNGAQNGEKHVADELYARCSPNKKNSEKAATKPMECYYNVTNKADALLGAILRTSKDPRKGLTDISNGARPRTIMLNAPIEMEIAKNGAIKPLDNDNSLPSSLNKGLIRLRELFKKEQDAKNVELLTSEKHSEKRATKTDKFSNTSNSYGFCNSKVQHKNSKERRVQRRIDFSNFPESTNRSGNQNESPVEFTEEFTETCNSRNKMYRNPLFHNRDYSSQNFSAKKNDCRGGVFETNQYGSPPGQKERGQEENLNNDINYEPNMKSQWEFSIEIDSKNGYSNYKKSNANHIDQTDSSPTVAQEYQAGSDIDNGDTLDKVVPSAIEQERFRRSLGNATSMVFHSRTGLPLTSSPAPLRRGSCCFDYDSTLNSVSSKRSALFELNTPPSPGAVSLEEGDRETENICEEEETPKRRTTSRGPPHSHALLGSFEESALNGRLEPVSTVHGFTAEIGASGLFCPKHRKLPVTVFFYTLGDNDKVSTPYLAHINLGKKGYQVPRSGTIQVTLLNPLGTVVKMFVVMYDLSDMPSRSHTFLRQRTLRDKTLRYLIHLRFMSGKSGRIYLHTDIRMIICRKSDVDTASDFAAEPPKELRSFVHGPTNPKFSPRF